MKTARLKNGVLLLYEKAAVIPGNSPTYQFTRGKLGVIALVPCDLIDTLDVVDQGAAPAQTQSAIHPPGNPWGAAGLPMTTGDQRPRNIGAEQGEAQDKREP